MPAISPSTNVVRSSFQEPTVARLRMAAEQAQQAADKLQLQARDAWQQAARAEASARGLDSRATQALADAGQAQERLVTFAADMGKTPEVPSLTDTEAPQLPAEDVPSPSPASPWSTTPFVAGVNSLGQGVGAFLNVTA